MIDTDSFSLSMRDRCIDLDGRRILITDFRGSEQERDLTVPANCDGVGRIRHFRRATAPGWPANPLPIDPASRALGLATVDTLEAQVFQNAACNWRCWYCFVPFDRLSADPSRSRWLTAEELVALYVAERNPPNTIDLTGGQPDLTPEWVPWMMAALDSRALADSVYLWSDDNLSNDYYFRYLSEADRERVATYRLYGRVGCFKGFDATSFTFNTKAAPELFPRQFDLMARLLSEGLDMYAYATFTTPNAVAVSDEMARFVDRLQRLDERMPLRTVPLRIIEFTPVTPRMGEIHRASLDNQERAIEAWNRELADRFSAEDLAKNIADIRVGCR